MFTFSFPRRHGKVRATKAAEWWANKLDSQYSEKREMFKQALYFRLINHPNWDKLQNDYDPDDILLAALEDVEIECRGYLFSGDGIFPSKTTMLNEKEGIRVKVGYGEPFTNLT